MPVKKKTASPIDLASEKAPTPITAKPARSAAPKAPAATHKPAVHKPAPRKTTAFETASHHDEIAHEAYLLWLKRGAAHGQAHQDWLQAIELVRARYA